MECDCVSHQPCIDYYFHCYPAPYVSHGQHLETTCSIGFGILAPCIMVPCRQIPTKEYFDLKISSALWANEEPQDIISVSGLDVNQVKMHELLRDGCANHGKYGKFEYSNEEHALTSNAGHTTVGLANSSDGSTVRTKVRTSEEGAEMHEMHAMEGRGSMDSQYDSHTHTQEKEPHFCPMCEDVMDGLRYCAICGSELVLNKGDKDNKEKGE